jgi:pimeloyl-ACP methyl ester carboxylesterase
MGMQAADDEVEWDPASAAKVAEVARTARIERTVSGSGDMVWHIWGEGPPVVLLHGGAGSWNHWIRTVPVLSRTHQLFVADIPGLGDSAMPHHPVLPETIAEVVAYGIRQVVPRGARPQVVGFSFGGHIGGLAAKLMGDKIRDLTLVGVAALGLPHPQREPFEKERVGMSPAEIDEVYRGNLATLMFADPAKIDPLALYLQRINVRRARFRSPPHAHSDGLRRALAEVIVPLKTIWGTRDYIATPSIEARLAVLGEHHPELQVRLIEGAGHWVAYEAADAFNAALNELLAM